MAPQECSAGMTSWISDYVRQKPAIQDSLTYLWTWSSSVLMPTLNWASRGSSSLSLICPLNEEVGWGRVGYLVDKWPTQPRTMPTCGVDKVEMWAMCIENCLMEYRSKGIQGESWDPCMGPRVGCAGREIQEGDDSNGQMKVTCIVPCSAGCRPWLDIYETG